MKDILIKVCALFHVPELKDKIISFASGTTFSTTFFFLDIQQYLVAGTFKVAIAIAVGFCGGIAGLLSKDVYAYLRGLISKKMPNQ